MQYDELVKRLREKAGAFDYDGRPDIACDYEQTADAIEELSAKFVAEHELRVKALSRLCSWCGVCSEENRNAIGCDDIAQLDAVIQPRWIPVSEKLPEEPGMYIVFLRCGAELQDPGFPDDLSYVTAMHFDFDQRIWNDGTESYNANLDVVNKPHAYYVTHWMPLPEPPKEES